MPNQCAIDKTRNTGPKVASPKHNCLELKARAGGNNKHNERVTRGSSSDTRTDRGPRSNLFTPLPAVAQPAPGVHIQLAAAFLPGTSTRQPTAGWALEAHHVATDGTATLRLRAHGAAPARSTHGAAHAHVPPRHTSQAAHHTAAAAALRCLEHTPCLQQLGHATLTLASPTTYLDLETPASQPATRPAPQRAARTTRGKLFPLLGINKLPWGNIVKKKPYP